MKEYFYLLYAIIFEVIGTTMLKLSDGFSNFAPSIGVIVGFGISFTFMMFALQMIPLSLAYSIWAGLGTAGTGLISVIVFSEFLSGINIIGLIIIITGVVIMNMSNNRKHQKQSNTG